MAKKIEKKHDELENVENVLSASEAFIEKYQKQILLGVGAVILLVLIVLSVKNFYIEPREKNAANAIYKAQQYFSVDSFKVALDGDGRDCEGFKNIASDYGITSSGKLAAAYAGICYYKLGQYESAIKYLSQFDGDNSYFKTSVIGLIGDSYVELNETSKALDYFEKAANQENDVLSPVYLKKAGIVYESQNQPEKAEKTYTTIKEKYPKSNEASDIDKYIARVQK